MRSVNLTERKGPEEELRESEKRLRNTFDNMLEGCQIIGFDWHYLYVNDAVARHGRRAKEELLGHTMMEMYPGIEDTEMFAALRRCMEKRIPHHMENEFAFPDGSTGWFELSIEPVPEGIFILSIDVTERKQGEEALRRANRALKTLSECNQALVRATEETDLLHEMCRIIVEVGGYHLAWAGFAEQDERKTVRPVAQVGYENGYLETVNITWADTERGRGPTGKAIRSGEPSVARRIPTDPDFEPWRAEAIKRGYASLIALPLIANGGTIGALNIYATEPDAFDTEEVKLLTELTDDLAYGVVALRTRAERKRAEEALRESEEWYHDLIESAHDMIQSVAPDGRFVFVNGAWLETLGYTEAELPDLNLWTIIHPESLLHCQEMFSRVVAGESIRNVQATFLTKDGRSILVEGNVTGRYTGGELVATHGFFRDITERKRAEEALWESEERFRSLFENSTIGLYRTTHDGRILLANPTLVRMLGYSSFDELALRNLEEEGFKPDYPRSRFREQIEREGEVRGLEAAWTRRDGSVIFVRESAKAIRDADGTILYYEGTVEDITERKRAEERLQHSLQKLRKALGGIIQAVTLTVEARDPYTAGHQRRMTNLARAIATEMGLSEEQIDGIRMAGAIHDLGKISVPAGILNKPGRLTEPEFGIIQAHPQVGYDILKTIEFPWPVAEIVFQHHERMDGSGYPRGLVGEEILLEARILAVADVVEAMSSHRPYRPALGIDKALEEISQNRGVLYDPEVVDACLRLFAEKGFKLE